MEILARAVGRRKEAVAQVQLVRGNGKFIINGKLSQVYLQNNSCSLICIKAPLQAALKLFPSNGDNSLLLSLPLPSNKVERVAFKEGEQKTSPLKEDRSAVLQITQSGLGGIVSDNFKNNLEISPPPYEGEGAPSISEGEKGDLSISDLSFLDPTSFATTNEPLKEGGKKGVVLKESPIEVVNTEIEVVNTEIEVVNTEIEVVNTEIDIIIKVKGGGLIGQAEAIKLGVARAFCILENSSVGFGLRKVLKASGYLRQDSRVKERKKYGLKKARKASQYHKR